MQYRHFTEQVDDCLAARHWNRSELAEEMGISRGRISIILKDEAMATSESIEKIAKALNVSPLHFDLYVALRLPEIAKQSPDLIQAGRTILKSQRLRSKTR